MPDSDRVFKCFLFPSSDEYPNTDYLHILEDPENVSNVDICLLVYEHIMAGVSKFSTSCKLNGRKPKQFEFCYYILGVYYLDSLDFGARLIDQSLPRISVWNGNMIKFFSELDYRKKNIFGKRQLKKNLARCYREFGPQEETVDEISYGPFVPPCFSTGFKENLHFRFDNALEAKVIDGIIDSVQAAALANVDKSTKCELCVNNVLHFLIACKSSVYKESSSEINVLAGKTPELDKTACAPTSRIPAMNSSRSNLDVACNPEVVNPNVFTLASGSSSPMPLHFDSPIHVLPKSVEACTINTAPSMQPLKKVNKDKVHISSPISRLNFSESPILKDSDGSNDGVRLNATRNNNATITTTSSPKPQPVLQSPEVQITGYRSSSLKQVEAGKSLDDLYNSMAILHGNKDIQPSSSKNQAVGTEAEYTDLSQHAVDERVQKDELIMLQAKNWLFLPLLPNRRFPVSNLDIKHFSAIVDLAYTLGVQKSCAVQFSKVHCSFISLGQSLQREGHVDNFLIPLFCRKLFEDNHPSKSLRHHFFSFIGECILDCNNGVQLEMISKALLGAASASKGKRLELSDTLFFPICRSRHWFTFCVDFKYKLFVFLDSLYNKEHDFHTSIKNLIIKNFVRVWKIVFKTDENIFKNFGIIYPHVPKQGNGLWKFLDLVWTCVVCLARRIFCISEFSMQTSCFFVQRTSLTSQWFLVFQPRYE
ncbi:unnamed protein product [Alopecurus aequalis]